MNTDYYYILYTINIALVISIIRIYIQYICTGEMKSTLEFDTAVEATIITQSYSVHKIFTENFSEHVKKLEFLH